MRSALYIISSTAVVLFVATEGAFAGVSVPGPVAAVGAPALLVIGGAYWIVRRIRARRR